MEPHGEGVHGEEVGEAREHGVQDRGGVDTVADQDEGEGRGEVRVAAFGVELPEEEGREGEEAAEEGSEEEGGGEG